jgi:hypothetical protein
LSIAHGSFDCGVLGRDGDALLQRAHFQGERQVHVHTGVHDDLALDFREAGQVQRDLIGARVQVQKSELSLTVGDGRPRRAADRCRSERYVDAGQDAALFICNRSVNIAGRDLRTGSRYGAQNDGQYQDNDSFHGRHSFFDRKPNKKVQLRSLAQSERARPHQFTLRTRI